MKSFEFWLKFELEGPSGSSKSDCIRKSERRDGRQRAVGGAARAPGAVLPRGPREAALASSELLPVGAAALPPVRDVLRRGGMG